MYDCRSRLDATNSPLISFAVKLQGGFNVRHLAFASVIFAACAVLAPARADNLSGTERFICSAGSVSVCCDDGQCGAGTAAELNLPQFVEVDLAAKSVSTTKASGLNRMSPIEGLTRADGQIVFHGVQNGRAYSFVVIEDTGEMTAAIAAPGCSISAFGACTPLPAAK